MNEDFKKQTITALRIMDDIDEDEICLFWFGHVFGVSVAVVAWYFPAFSYVFWAFLLTALLILGHRFVKKLLTKE